MTPHQPYVDFADWWQAGRKRFNKVDRRCFDSLAILTFWIIWKERNQRTFDHVAHSVEEVVSRAFEEALAWVQAGFSSLTPFLSRCGFQNLAHLGRCQGRTLCNCIEPLLHSCSALGHELRLVDGLFVFSLLMKYVRKNVCWKLTRVQGGKLPNPSFKITQTLFISWVFFISLWVL